LAPRRMRRVSRRLTGRSPALATRIEGLLDTLDTGLAGIRAPSHLPSTVLWSALIWVSLIGTTWACLLAAHLDLGVVAALTTLAFLGLGVSLPSSPGFVGVIQAAAWAALRLFDVPLNEALSFSILLHVSQFVPVTVWGLILLLVEHVSLSEAGRPHERPPVSTGT
jgi:glycosyltransferase 2 family protein